MLSERVLPFALVRGQTFAVPSSLPLTQTSSPIATDQIGRECSAKMASARLPSASAFSSTDHKRAFAPPPLSIVVPCTHKLTTTSSHFSVRTHAPVVNDHSLIVLSRLPLATRLDDAPVPMHTHSRSEWPLPLIVRLTSPLLASRTQRTPAPVTAPLSSPPSPARTQTISSAIAAMQSAAASIAAHLSPPPLHKADHLSVAAQCGLSRTHLFDWLHHFHLLRLSTLLIAAATNHREAQTIGIHFVINHLDLRRGLFAAI